MYFTYMIYIHMNPRKFLLSNLAWCPGIGAASRFIPDIDIPPRIMLAYVLALTGLFASTYMITYTSLSSLGFPSAETVKINQISPKLVYAGDEMYLAAGIEVGHGSDTVENRKIFLARMTVDGQVFNVNEAFDTGGDYLSTYDIIRTADGEWYTIYKTYTLGMSGDRGFIHSSDGAYWENVNTNNKAPGIGIGDASLIEVDNGDVLLFYTKQVGPTTEIGEGYTMYMARYSPQDGWSAPEKTPFKWMRVSSFRDVNGSVCIVGIAYIGDDFRSYLAQLMEDGSWSEPIDLNYTGSSRVDILYSENRNGYFLLGHGNLDNRYVQVCFSEDLRSLNVLKTFAPAQNPSLVELANGMLVMVYENEFYKKVSDPFFGTGVYGQWTELYTTSSVDGVNWTTQHSVEGLEDEAGLNIVASGRRFLASVFLSVIVMFLLLLFLRYKHLF
jgi:hypothetical protein